MNLINNKYKGIFLIIMSALFFSLMATTVKSVNMFPLVQKVFFRNFIGVIILSLFIFKDKTILKINNKKLVFARCAFGLTGVFLYYKSISLLNLSEAVVLNKLSPFFVIILSAIVLKEKIKITQIIAIFIALIGLLILLKPQMNIDIYPAVLGILGAMFAGSAYTTIRYLRLFDSPTTIAFYFCLTSTIITFPLMLSDFVIPSAFEMIRLCAIGVFALIAQLLMTNAYHFAPASELSIYTYFNIVFSTILGVLLWSENLTISFIWGTLLIFIAGFINFYTSHKNNK